MASAPNRSKKDVLVIGDLNFWQCGSCPFLLSAIVGREDAEGFHRTQYPGCLSLTSGLEPDAVIVPSLTSKKDQIPKEVPDFQDEIATIQELSCTICLARWRNVATKACRHLVCCDACLHQMDHRHCIYCRGDIIEELPVKFHSSKLLEEISIPDASSSSSVRATNTSPNDILVAEMVAKFCQMGFEERRVKMAIQRNMPRPSGHGHDTLPSENVVLDSLLDTANISADEMESFLNDPEGDLTVKRQISDYLSVVTKCMLCKERAPDICLLPCGHLAVCRLCREDAEKMPRNCPDCGELIGNQFKVHM